MPWVERKFPSRGQASLVTVVRQNSLWDSLKGSGFVLFFWLQGLQQHLVHHLAPRRRCTEPPLHPPGGRAGQAGMFTPRQSLFIGCLVWMVKSLLLPGVHSNSPPSSRWCHPVISSSVVPFSSCPQSLPASESFPISQLFAWGGQSTGVSALASVLPKNTRTDLL